MNCFKFPKKTCMELDSLISDFFWGRQKEEGRIHWLAWHKLTKSKRQGGMGFRDFSSFNDALLAKHAWRLLNSLDDLWAKQMKGLYFPNGNFLEAKKGARASWGWSSLLVGRELLASNLMWRVGNGVDINIWRDKWIPGIEGGSLGPGQGGAACNLQTVSELIVEGRWELEGLRQWISSEEYNVICSIPLPLFSTDDRRVWAGTRNGVFTVKSGYFHAKMCDDRCRQMGASSSLICSEDL